MSTPLRILGIPEEFNSDSPDRTEEASVKTGPRPQPTPHRLSLNRQVTFEPGKGEADSLQLEGLPSETQEQAKAKLARLFPRRVSDLPFPSSPAQLKSSCFD